MRPQEEVLQLGEALRRQAAAGDWSAATESFRARQRLLTQLLRPELGLAQRRELSRLILELLEGDRRVIEQLSAARDTVAAELRRVRQGRSAVKAYVRS